MSCEKILAQWRANPSKKDATYSDAETLLLHYGFVSSKKTHTNHWSHELLTDHPKFVGGFIQVTKPHGKGKSPNLSSSTVRDIVEAIKWVSEHDEVEQDHAEPEIEEKE